MAFCHVTHVEEYVDLNSTNKIIQPRLLSELKILLTLIVPRGKEFLWRIFPKKSVFVYVSWRCLFEREKEILLQCTKQCAIYLLERCHRGTIIGNQSLFLIQNVARYYKDYIFMASGEILNL